MPSHVTTARRVHTRGDIAKTLSAAGGRETGLSRALQPIDRGDADSLADRCRACARGVARDGGQRLRLSGHRGPTPFRAPFPAVLLTFGRHSSNFRPATAFPLPLGGGEGPRGRWGRIFIPLKRRAPTFRSRVGNRATLAWLRALFVPFPSHQIKHLRKNVNSQDQISLRIVLYCTVITESARMQSRRPHTPSALWFSARF